MKRIICSLLVALTLLASICGVLAYADFGSGVAVSTADAKVIKSTLYGKKMTFSDLDIKQALCITDFKSITITKIPDASEGALMYGGRRVSDGLTIKRKNIPSLVFIPASKEVEGASFYFTVDDLLDGAEIEFRIRYTDKINYEPKMESDAATSVTASTQREIGVYSRMRATDAEGDELEYMVVSYPKYGTLEVLDKKSGKYLYTPRTSFVGSDSFSYVCRDEWGNFSTVCTVAVSIGERMSEVVYADMKGREEYCAGIAMTAAGIMGGALIGDDMYFMPDEKVSKAEFVCMAMKLAGRKAEDLKSSFFDDDEDIPTPLVSYVATAQRSGLIQGEFTNGKLLFHPNEAITRYEAATILAKLSGKKSEGEVPVFNDLSSVPTWARDAVYAMYNIGVFKSEDGMIYGDEKVTRAECAAYLYEFSSKCK